MKKWILRLFILIGVPILISVHHTEVQQEFTEYFDQLNEKYDGNKDEILVYINQKIQSKEINSLEKGINLLARAHYLYLGGKTELIDYADEAEAYLTLHKQDKELLHLYSILSSRYTGIEQYSNAYIYIYRGEQIAEKIYSNEKTQQNLATLVAIKYLKVVVALQIGLINEADTIFLEAEQLRNTELINHERIDIYSNIIQYHIYKKDYELVEEYSFKLLQTIKEKDPDLYTYSNDWVRTQIILAQNYLYQDNLPRCLEIIEQLDQNDIVFNSKKYHSDLYSLYAEISLYYNQPKEALNYFTIAYQDLKESRQILRKIRIVYDLIEILGELNDEQQLLNWYEVERQLMQELFDIKDSQYLLKQIINTDLQNAKYNIEVLKLQKSNLNYLIILLSGFLGLSLVIVIMEQRRKKLMNSNLLMLSHNLHIKHEYYEDMKIHQDNLKRVKHDLKNHMVIIHQLIKDEEYEAATKYIQSIEEKIDFPLSDVITQNKIIDAILVNKLSICREKGINLQLDIKIPIELSIDEFDLCVVYSNLLDNAIEACEQMSENEIKYIKLKSFIKEDYLYLSIKNSFSSELKIKENKLLTLKKDKFKHGLGIENIKNSVEKYDGHMRMTYEKQEFNVSIILNIK